MNFSNFPSFIRVPTDPHFRSSLTIFTVDILLSTVFLHFLYITQLNSNYSLPIALATGITAPRLHLQLSNLIDCRSRMGESKGINISFICVSILILKKICVCGYVIMVKAPPQLYYSLVFFICDSYDPGPPHCYVTPITISQDNNFVINKHSFFQINFYKLGVF